MLQKSIFFMKKSTKYNKTVSLSMGLSLLTFNILPEKINKIKELRKIYCMNKMQCTQNLLYEQCNGHKSIVVLIEKEFLTN